MPVSNTALGWTTFTRIPWDHEAEYALPLENLHAVLNRLRRAIPRGEGVLVANDLLELALASAVDCNRAVVQNLHGDNDYYYDLAERHENVIDTRSPVSLNCPWDVRPQPGADAPMCAGA